MSTRRLTPATVAMLARVHPPEWSRMSTRSTSTGRASMARAWRLERRGSMHRTRASSSDDSAEARVSSRPKVSRSQPASRYALASSGVRDSQWTPQGAEVRMFFIESNPAGPSMPSKTAPSGARSAIAAQPSAWLSETSATRAMPGVLSARVTPNPIGVGAF